MKPTRGFVVLTLLLAWAACARVTSAAEDNQQTLLQNSQDTNADAEAGDSSFSATSTNMRWQVVGDERDDQLEHNETVAEDADVPIQTPLSPNTSEDNDSTVPKLFPLTRSDYVGIVCAAVGLMIAAGGGIGGGGILVPIYLLLVKLPVKYAISTTSVTILGGSIANVLLNSFKRHPIHNHRSSVDWVLTLLVEPTQMGGTLVGTLLHDFLPDLLVIVLLLVLLSLTAFRTIDKANQLHAKETHSMARVMPADVRRGSTGTPDPESQRLIPGTGTNVGGTTAYKAVEVSQDSFSSPEQDTPLDEYSDTGEIAKLTMLFVVITALNLLKGSSSTRSSDGWLFWTTQVIMLLVIVCFVAWERAMILSRRSQGTAVHSDIEWDERSTIRYPVLSTLAGVVAGLFGIGGGIVMGPLMLEMGVQAQVAAATSAAMILYTSATASFGYLCFGRLLPDYSLVGLLLGFGATLIGQTAMTVLLHRHQRPSYIAYCIGTVVAISAVCMSLESVLAMLEALT